MIVAEEAFWANYIAKRELPEPSGIDNEDDYISALYPADQATDAVVRLPDEMEQLGIRYLEISELIKELEEEKKQIKDKFIMAIGFAKIGVAGSIEAPISRYTRSQFHKDLFEKDYPGVYENYTETSFVKSLKIRRRG
jgi:predicted phage-related endonuclease